MLLGGKFQNDDGHLDPGQHIVRSVLGFTELTLENHKPDSFPSFHLCCDLKMNWMMNTFISDSRPFLFLKARMFHYKSEELLTDTYFY